MSCILSVVPAINFLITVDVDVIVIFVATILIFI